MSSPVSRFPLNFHETVTVHLVSSLSYIMTYPVEHPNADVGVQKGRLTGHRVCTPQRTVQGSLIRPKRHSSKRALMRILQARQPTICNDGGRCAHIRVAIAVSRHVESQRDADTPKQGGPLLARELHVAHGLELTTHPQDFAAAY